MTGKDYKIISSLPLLSLLVGTLVGLYGSMGRDRPAPVEPIWKWAEEISSRIVEKQLTLKEGEKKTEDFLKYSVLISRFSDESPSFEKYLLQFHSNYEHWSASDWSPASWELGMVISKSESGPRKGYIVASKKLKE